MGSQPAMGSPKSFLDLSGETRNLVYRDLLQAGNDINVSRFLKKRPQNIKQRVVPQGLGLEPAILRVNRQICSEATGILHGENTFIVEEQDGSFEVRHMHFRVGLPYDSYGVPHPASRNLVRTRLHSGIHKVKNFKVVINLSEPVEDEAIELVAMIMCFAGMTNSPDWFGVSLSGTDWLPIMRACKSNTKISLNTALRIILIFIHRWQYHAKHAQPLHFGPAPPGQLSPVEHSHPELHSV